MSSRKPRKDGTVVFTRAGCPKCRSNTVPLVLTSGHLVWDVHSYVTWGGSRLHCAASAQRLCDQPARDIRFETGTDTPTCPHESA